MLADQEKCEIGNDVEMREEGIPDSHPKGLMDL